MLKSKRTLLIGIASFSLIAQSALATPVIVETDDTIRPSDLQQPAARTEVEAPEYDNESPVTLVQVNAPSSTPRFTRPVPHGPVVSVAVRVPWPMFNVGRVYTRRAPRNRARAPRNRVRTPRVTHRTVPRNSARNNRVVKIGAQPRTATPNHFNGYNRQAGTQPRTATPNHFNGYNRQAGPQPRKATPNHFNGYNRSAGQQPSRASNISVAPRKHKSVSISKSNNRRAPVASGQFRKPDTRTKPPLGGPIVPALF